MPVISLSLSWVGESFTRPMIYDIIGQLQQIVKIADTAHIFFPGPIEANPTSQSSINEINDRTARFSGDRFLYVEVDEAYDPDELGSMAVNQQENVVIFLDKDVDVAVWPIYMKTDYVINFRYQTVSKTEADRWLADMRMRTTQMRDTPLHSIDYNYSLPDPILELLGVVHEHKKRLEPEPADFNEYLKSHSSVRLKKLADLTGKNSQYVIAERQSRIVGLFNTTPLPEKIERDGNSAGWLCTFSYKISVMKPDGIGCRYPIMIYNRLLDDRYIAFRRPQYNPDRAAHSIQTASMSDMAMFESDRQLTDHLNIYLPYQIPDYDEFILKKAIAAYGITLSILVEVDEAGSKDLFNLMDIDPYEIDPDILTFIKESEYLHMTRAYHSILHIGLFENYKFKHDCALKVDNSWNVSTILDLDPKKIYHVALAVCIDPSYLKQEAVNRLKKYPAAFAKIVTLVNEGLRDNIDLAVISKKTVITKMDFDKFFRFYIPGNPKGLTNKPSLYKTPSTDPDLISLNMSRRDKPTVEGPYRAFPNDVVRGNFIGFNITQLASVISIKTDAIKGNRGLVT